MLADLTTLLTIATFAFYGTAAFALAKRQVTRDDLLLAPALGLGIAVIPAVWLTCAGLAGAAFAVPMAAALAAFSMAALAWRRPGAIALGSAAIPASITTAVVLLVVGLPQLHYGFGWMSFSNDDMATYLLDATRLTEHPQYAEPTFIDLLSGRHAEGWSWFVFTRNGDRYGFDLLLALAGVAFRIGPLAAYMPLVLAMHASLALATAALFGRGRSTWAVTFIAAVVALAPACVVPVYYQLGPQIGGLAVLAAAYALFKDDNGSWSTIALGGIAFSGLLMIYPEVAGFLGIALVLAAIASAATGGQEGKRAALRTMLKAAGGCALGVAYLGLAGVNALSLVVAKVRYGVQLPSHEFDTSLTPSGLASMFGFNAIDTYVHGPWAVPALLGGIALFLCVVAWVAHATFAGDRRGNSLTLAMILLFMFLCAKRNGYGTFKIILYMQPFLNGSVADLALWRPSWAGLRLAPLAAYAIVFVASFPTLEYYIARSDDPLPISGSTYTQIPTASASHLAGDLDHLAGNAHGHTVISDSSTVSLSKIENITFAGDPMQFPSSDPYDRMKTYEPLYGTIALPLSQSLQQDRYAGLLLDSYQDAAREDRDLPVNVPSCCPVAFSIPEEPPLTSDALLLYQGQNLTILNRNGSLPAVRSVGLTPYAKASNVLIFVDSSLSIAPNYSRGQVGIFGLEPDYFVSGGSMSGVGRYLLFEIVNPKRPRLELWFTRSLNRASETDLPASIDVIGTKRESIELGGSGSARVVSQPVDPFRIGGNAYIALDLSETPKAFGVTTVPLAGLYNGDLISDDRKLVGFARDISLVGDDAAGSAAQMLSRFPNDLIACCTQYSGIYEDGWASKDSWYALRSDASSGSLVVSGSVPAGLDANALRIVLDGRTMLTRTLVPGVFSYTLSLPPAFRPGVHRIALHFSEARPLGSGDVRAASAQLTSVGFASR